MCISLIFAVKWCVLVVYNFSLLILKTFGPSITAASQSSTESNSTHHSSDPPTILITAPSREDIHASNTNITLADAVKERRPSFTPIVVGRKVVNKK